MIGALAVVFLLPLALLPGGESPFLEGKRAGFAILSIGAAGVLLAAGSLREGVRRAAASPLAPAAVAWVAVALAGTLAGPAAGREWSAIFVRVGGAAWMLAVAVPRDPRMAGKIGTILLVAVLLAGGYALLQFHGIDPWGWDRSFAGGAPPSTLGNPLFLGATLAGAAPWAAAALVAGPVPARMVAVLAAPLLLAALVVSQARGAWLGAAVALAWFARAPELRAAFRSAAARRGVAAAMALSVVAVCAAGWRGDGASAAGWARHAAGVARGDQWRGRLMLWEAGGAMIRRAPVLGRGPGTVRREHLREQAPLRRQPRYAGLPHRSTEHSHQDALQSWVEAGAIGLGIRIWAVCIALRAGLASGAGPWRRAAACAVLAWVVDGAVNGPAHLPPTEQLLWICLGLAVRVPARRRAAPSPALRSGPARAALACAAAVAALPFARAALGDLWLSVGTGFLGRDPAGAVAALVRADALLRDDRRQWFHLGRARFESGDFTRAAEAFRRDAGVHPWSASAWYNLGCAFAALGDTSSARACFAEASRLDPEVRPPRAGGGGAHPVGPVAGPGSDGKI